MSRRIANRHGCTIEVGPTVYGRWGFIVCTPHGRMLASSAGAELEAIDAAHEAAQRLIASPLPTD